MSSEIQKEFNVAAVAGGMVASIAGVFTYLHKVAEMVGNKDSDRDLHAQYQVNMRIVLAWVISSLVIGTNSKYKTSDLLGFPLGYVSTTSMVYFFFQFLANRKII